MKKGYKEYKNWNWKTCIEQGVITGIAFILGQLLLIKLGIVKILGN